MSKPLDYEHAAMHGDPMPDGLAFPDQLMFQALSLLYARYRAKTITREQASQEKQRLLHEHEIFSARWALGEHWAETVKKTELAASSYRKERTLGNADKLLEALEGR